MRVYETDYDGRCAVCGKPLHKPRRIYCSDKCMHHKRDTKGQFPYTPETEEHICIWHYKDSGFSRMTSENNPEMSIWNDVGIQKIEDIVKKCQKNGKYKKYINKYISSENI